MPIKVLDLLYYDCITEDFGRIIASVFNGNLYGIFDLIEDKKVDCFVRDQGIVALKVLVYEGIIEREKAVKYLMYLLKEKIINTDDIVIIKYLVEGLKDLYPVEAMDLINIAFEDGLVNEFISVSLNDVNDVLEMEQDLYLREKKKEKQSKFIGHIDDV